MVNTATKRRSSPALVKETSDALTWDQVIEGAALYWGPIGRTSAEQLAEWGRTLFGGELPPAPLVLGRPSCVHGHWFPNLQTDLSQRSGFEHKPAFNYAPPRKLDRIRRSDLLRGCMARFLNLKGLDPTPGRAPWNDLVMRLHMELTGKTIWVSERTERYARELDPNAPADSSMTRLVKVVDHPLCPKTGSTPLKHERNLSWPVGSIDLGDITA